MATIMDVARAAGVSGTTVSRILNDVPGYTYPEATRQRVIQATRRLKYQASPIARALLRSRTNVVAIAVGEPDDYHYAIPLRRAHALATARGMTTTLVLPDSGMELETILERGQADVGLLARDSLDRCHKLLDALVASHQIVVAAGPRYRDPLPIGVRVAYWEESEGFRLALEHLHSLGHCAVTYLSGLDTGPRPELAREQAEQLGLELHGIALDIPSERSMTRLEEGAEMARRVLQMSRRPTALFARTDDVALGAMHVICKAGLRVPEDISVMGYFDVPYSAFASPPITTIHTPFTECVEAVMQAALDALLTDSAEKIDLKNERFTCHLVRRDSTAGPSEGSSQ